MNDNFRSESTLILDSKIIWDTYSVFYIGAHKKLWTTNIIISFLFKSDANSLGQSSKILNKIIHHYILNVVNISYLF